jgi:hypothetical protein
MREKNRLGVAIAFIHSSVHSVNTYVSVTFYEPSPMLDNRNTMVDGHYCCFRRHRTRDRWHKQVFVPQLRRSIIG